MASHFSICFSLFILAYFVTFSSAAVTSWQEEFEMKIEAKMNKLIETKNIQLEGKVTQLETQLEEKVTQLETQLELNNELRTRLEAKVQEQETILNFLLQENELPISSAGSKSIASNYRQNVIQSNGRSGIPRTCRELRAANPSLASGLQWIDPDGQGIGDDPIFVYCDMSSGSTSILHDSEFPIDVGHCTDPGCYSRSINYNASSKQMKTLAELSTECHQSIKYDCYYAPLEFGNIEYAWWNDRDGNAQNFWAGNNTNGIHTCQCGIDGNCVDPGLKCNCDSAAPIQLVDDGVLTNKNILPVTRLNFGRTQLATSSGIHTLGRLVCSGSAALNGFPTSCEDLWFIGHTLNGLYSVMEGELVKSVHCDFTKLPSDASFQSLIGYAEVKPKPTYSGIPTSCANLKAVGHTSSGLYLVMEGELVKNVYCNFTKLPSDASSQSLIGYAEVKPKPTYSGIPTSCANLKAAGHTSSGLYPVMGDKTVDNVYCDFTKPINDGGFQKKIGYFDVKTSPVYFHAQKSQSYGNVNTVVPFEILRLNLGGGMSTSGIFTAPKSGKYFFTFSGISERNAEARVDLQVKTDTADWTKVGEALAGEGYRTYSQQATFDLTKGNQIRLLLMSGVIHDTNSYTSFVGHILEEEIVQ